MRVRILYHDHCFDGAASAAFFSRFCEQKFAPNAEFGFTGLAHKATQLFEDSYFDGDINPMQIESLQSKFSIAECPAH